jgi:hypothetical protein
MLENLVYTGGYVGLGHREHEDRILNQTDLFFRSVICSDTSLKIIFAFQPQCPLCFGGEYPV